MSIAKRCRQLQRRFGIRVGETTLRSYYKQAKIKYRYPVRSLDTAHSEDKIRSLRVDFL